MAIHQLIVKLLNGRSQCFQFADPSISGESLKLHLSARTLIPPQFLRVVTGCREIADQTLIHAAPDGLFPSVTVLLRLPGGKGGFGSLLRGAATKAGQKKTNNFDACRDMSGRRLRHVNAEKKIEEWMAEADDRRLEKIAEDFLKKKGKEVKKDKEVDVEKYLEKYREDSKKCMGEVEESVKQSFGLYKDAKRKVLPSSEPSLKKLKIWLGKKKMEESDSDEDDSEDEDEMLDRDGSVTEEDRLVTENKVEHESSSVSGPCASSDGEFSGISSTGKQSGDVNEDSLAVSCFPSLEPVSSGGNSESDDTVEIEKGVHQEIAATDVAGSVQEMPIIVEPAAQEEVHVQPNDTEKGLENVIEIAPAVNISAIIEEPLNFDKYNTAAELEVLGLERLKVELQSRGLKCGGTLQERACRLFLLKTTPVDKLPKKLLAKPSAAN